MNAVVIDIKDFSGYITYDIKNSDVEKYGAKQIRTPKINSLIKKFHDENIYVIARITIFQDPILAKARPDLAIHSKKDEGLWLDHKGLAWMDPASKEVWDYNVAIGKDALGRGFDELNFDYIRFASDGFIGDMGFPVWDEIIPKQEVIKNFFKYLREQFSGAKISADIFGQATIDNNDLGIGQIIEDAYAYFDYVCPMVYPSHYAKMFLGYKNPANYPYEVVRYSMESAINRLKIYDLRFRNNGLTNFSSSSDSNLKSEFLNPKSKLRPWLQDFDLGADYDAEKVKKQIQAVYDSFCSPASGRDAQICSPSSNNFGDKFGGWMLWNPSNVYTKEALEVGN